MTGTALAPGSGRLVADIGGTHARFAWQAAAGAPLVDHMTVACQAYANIAEAMHAVLSTWRRQPAECALAIATTITGDSVRMTNRGWNFSRAELQRAFALRRLEVLNDFSALARAVPHVERADLRQLGGQLAVERAPIGVLGPGTGLGVSGLLPGRQSEWVVLESEGGHATLPVEGDFEREVVARLERRFGHVSAERVLSGAGLTNLHATLAAMADGSEPPTTLDAAAITLRALQDRDPICVQTLQQFCAFLGSVAGNLALTLGARGGIYLGGGIVPRLGAFLETSSFRARFEGKGRFASFLAAIPVFAIHSGESPALQGAARWLDDKG